MRYAQLDADVQENLRSKAVTTWFESAETRPGNNAKADTAAREMLVRCSQNPANFYDLVHLYLFSSCALARGRLSHRTNYSDVFFQPPPHPTLFTTLTFLLYRFTSSMEADLRTASEELVKVRRERLRALYASDKQAWQAALAARGLAMEM